MDRRETTANLLERWRAGDEEAAEEIYNRYADRLWKFAKSRLGQRFERRVGADDVLQSVFRTFFRRTKEGQYTIDRSSSLWHLLAKMTINKVLRHVGYNTAQQRDIGKEIYLDAEEVSPEAIASALAVDGQSADILIDQFDRIFDGLSDPESEIVRLCLEGYSNVEISGRVRCSRWTVRRVLNRVGVHLQRRLREDCDN